MNKKTKRFILAVLFLLASGGFLLQFWPVEVVAVLCASLFGFPLFALGTGILLDIAYGAPMGLMHFLFFPFTLIACLGLILRILGKRYFIHKTPQEHI